MILCVFVGIHWPWYSCQDSAVTPSLAALWTPWIASGCHQGGEVATLSTGHAALLLTSSDDMPCQGPPVATPQLPRNQAACAFRHAKASVEGSPLPCSWRCWGVLGEAGWNIGKPSANCYIVIFVIPQGHDHLGLCSTRWFLTRPTAHYDISWTCSIMHNKDAVETDFFFYTVKGTLSF